MDRSSSSASTPGFARTLSVVFTPRGKAVLQLAGLRESTADRTHCAPPLLADGSGGSGCRSGREGQSGFNRYCPRPSGVASGHLDEAQYLGWIYIFDIHDIHRGRYGRYGRCVRERRSAQGTLVFRIAQIFHFSRFPHSFVSPIVVFSCRSPLLAVGLRDAHVTR